jgi:F-type H+-transporting ATPase subunit b
MGIISMAILEQLELNQSFFVQFVVFTVAYLALSRLVFAPYGEALAQREMRTKGGEDLAIEIQKKSDELRTQYETKARQVSGNVKSIFDQYRDEANKEYEKIVSASRLDAQKLVEAARQKVSVEIGDAKAKIKADVPVVAQEMTRRLLAK